MPTKIDDYQKYWDDVLEVDYDEFMSDIDNLRKAFHCAGALFHMADWLYFGHKAYIDKNFTFVEANGNKQSVYNETTFANSVRDLQSDFELIRGIANAGKHLEVRKGKHAASPISAANTYVTDPTGYGEGGYGMGLYGGAPRVMQEGPGGDIELTDLAKSVRDMWIAFCAKHRFPLNVTAKP